MKTTKMSPSPDDQKPPAPLAVLSVYLQGFQTLSNAADIKMIADAFLKVDKSAQLYDWPKSNAS